MTHLSKAELLQWRDEGRADDRERVVSHLATCRACAAELAELTRMAAIDDRPARFDPADFVNRGYAVRGPANAGPRDVRAGRAPIWTSWKLWAGAVSAVAVLTLVVTLGPERGGDGLRGGGDVVRGGGITITSERPAGSSESSADHPEVITWSSGVKTARFRVELLDASGAPIFQTMTTATRVVLPAEQLAGLTPGRSYVWKITALDDDGESITSASKTFSLAARGVNGSGAK